MMVPLSHCDLCSHLFEVILGPMFEEFLGLGGAQALFLCFENVQPLDSKRGLSSIILHISNLDLLIRTCSTFTYQEVHELLHLL
jgi:hypothetical protein